MRGRHRSRDGWRDLLAGDGIDAGLSARLAEYAAMLASWGPAVDLFGGDDPERVVPALTREALAALPWLDRAQTLVDVGSGNGFPAVPLLLARPALRGTLLEPRERRWAFLKEVVRELGVAAEVRRERADEHVGSYDAVTVRGVEIDAWFPATRRLLREGGMLLWWTSEAKAVELERRAADGRVLTFALPSPSRGVLAAWRRCST